MRKFCHNLDKEEKSYDTYSSIRYIYIHYIHTYIYIYTIYIHIYIYIYIYTRSSQRRSLRMFQVYGMFWVLREYSMALRSRLQETNVLEISFACVSNK